MCGTAGDTEIIKIHCSIKIKVFEYNLNPALKLSQCSSTTPTAVSTDILGDLNRHKLFIMIKVLSTYEVRVCAQTCAVK